jgi:pyrimidine-specific ribonucleoside hydrolase
MTHSRSRTIWGLFAILFFLVVPGCNLFSVPSTPEEQILTPTTSAPPSEIVVQGFPLAGTWSGYARNGAFEMEVRVSLGTKCKTGDECGSFNLQTIPCSGAFTLLNEIEGVYEFKAGKKQGTCGEGRDFLHLLSDGRLKYISRGDYGETLGVLYPEAESANAKKLWAIYDDDGSPDGTTALFYLLSEPVVKLKGISISHGEAHPAIYIQHIGRKLDEFGIRDIPLGAGQDAPLAGHNGFPEWLRESSNNFWGLPIPNQNKKFAVQNSAELMVSVIRQSPEPVTIFISGPCTNLAQALRLDDGIKANIAAVYIMGGAVYTPGNVHDFYPEDGNTVAEWNIYSDPQAAREVFESGLNIFLIPLDATNQVKVGKQDTSQWRKGGQIADSAADFYDMLLENNQTMAIWDLMTAVIMVHPSLCGFQPLHLEVVTTDGITSGQTILLKDSEPNMNVCLDPDGVSIKQMIGDTFSQSQ